MGMDAADLAGMRTTINELLPDVSVNARTGLTAKVRVDPNPREVTLSHRFRVRRWEMLFPDGTDMTSGDRITVTGMGDFVVQEKANPNSFSVSTLLYAIPTSLALAAVLPVEQMTFQRPSDLAHPIVGTVLVSEPGEEMALFGLSPDYKWRLIYEMSIRYPGNIPVGNGHQVLSAAIFGTDGSGNPRRSTIDQRPRPLMHNLPFGCIYLKEPA